MSRRWRRLRGWMQAEAEDVRILRDLERDALEWARHAHEREYLYSGARLSVAERWSEERAGKLTLLEGGGLERRPLGHAFLAASQGQRSRTKRMRSLMFALPVLLVVGGAYLFETQQHNSALHTGMILAKAEGAEDPLVGALLMAELQGEHEPPGGASVAHRVAQRMFPVAVLGDGGAIVSAAFSPNGTKVVSVRRDHTVQIWPTNGRGRPRLVGEPADVPIGEPDGLTGQQESAPPTVAVSADGSRLADWSDGTLRVWSGEDRTPIELDDKTDTRSQASPSVRMAATSLPSLVTSRRDGGPVTAWVMPG